MHTSDSAETRDDLFSSAPGTVPLARDLQGQPLRIPEQAAAWRVRRHTGGRPRILLDGSKQPMQLSLAYTLADLDDILAPGSYRLDLIDAKGEHLRLTVPVNIGPARDAGDDASSSDDDDDDDTVSSFASTERTDVRFLLEANVKSAQLAFQHNERTLLAGLQMADTLRSGLQALAESQADWIKSLVAARGFPRNGWQPSMPMPIPTLPAPANDGDEDDEDEDDGDPEPDKGERLMEFGLGVITLVNNLMAQFSSPKTGAATVPKASPGFDLRSVLNWQHAAKQGQVAREASLAATEGAPSDPTDLHALLASLPLDVSAKLMQVRTKLEPEEQTAVMSLVMNISRSELPAVIAELTNKSTDEIVALFRQYLAKRDQPRSDR